MEQQAILVKLGEIVLKGLNRRSFEEMLLKNMRRRLAHWGKFQVRSMQSTIYVTPLDEEADMEGAQRSIGKIFGVIAYTLAAVTEKDLGQIQRRAGEALAEVLQGASTFKVESRRSDKQFPLTSPQLSAEVGGYLLEQFPHLQVDVHHPDVVVRVEVREECAYLHAGTTPGAGGIPVGTGGKAAVLISGGLDSPVAAWMMARRGVELTGIHFASPPYTSELAHQKVVDLMKKVGEYAGRMKMLTVNFTHIQEQIRDLCPEELGTVLLRRFMLRAAEALAKKEGCSALITGESLGQVASQTMQAIACTDAVAGMPVFRPLIGSDKSEIVKRAYEIDTYDIAIQPYEDCCTIFTPRHPRTRPVLKFVEAAEEALDIPALLEEALGDIRVTTIS